MSLRTLGLSLYGPQAASHRVRLAQFQPGLAAEGIELQIQSLLGDAYLHRRFTGSRPSLGGLMRAYARRFMALGQSHAFDLAILYAELLPLLPAWVEQKLLQVPYIFDFDDAFHLKYRCGRLGRLNPWLGTKIDHLIAGASAVTAGNTYLASHARRFNLNVTVVPSVVDTDHYRPLAVPRSDMAPFTVGWIGSPSTAPYLQQLVEPLQLLARERPVLFMVVGGPPPEIPGVDVMSLPWTLEQEVFQIQQFDVGVMPLPDTPWTRGKCAYKLIQCMACGVPVVATPVGANIDVVPSECGLLACSSAEWLEAFRCLAADAQRRQEMGVAARHWVEARYSLRSALPVLSSVIRHVGTMAQR